MTGRHDRVSSGVSSPTGATLPLALALQARQDDGLPVTASTAQTRFRSHPRVVHETIDGEVILIQIETGYYYSLGGSGARMWRLLEQGRSIDEVAGALEHAYGGSAEIRPAVERLTEELRAETLLEPATSEPDVSLDDGTATSGVAGPFVPPLLERYEDMQDFLLVDPIHEVDDSGWPNKKTA
jgi:hypothetical protein